jgi:peroxiredoxin
MIFLGRNYSLCQGGPANCEPAGKIRMQADQESPPITRAPRWRRRLLEALLLVAVLVALHAWQTRHVVRGTAPEFAVRLLDGEEVSLSDYRGRPLLLQFWATWCPVCRLEQGSIDAIARDHQVLSVSLDDMGPREMQQWMAEQGVSYPVSFDDNGQISRRYGVGGVPTSIIVDAQGGIRFVEVGYTTQTGLRFRLWWAGR